MFCLFFFCFFDTFVGIAQKPSNAATAPSVSSTLPSPALATQDVKPSDDAPDPMPATDDGGTGRASDSNDVKIGVTDAQELKTPPPSAVAAPAPVAAKEPNEAAHGPKTPKTSEAAVESEAKGQGQDLASTRATTAEASEDEDIDVKPDGIKLELLQPRETTQILQEDGTRMSMAYDDNIGPDCDKIDAVSSNVTSVSNVAAALGGPALISVIPGTSYFPVAAMPVGDLNNQTPISSFIGTFVSLFFFVFVFVFDFFFCICWHFFCVCVPGLVLFVFGVD